jgi:transposase InsO family protein
LQDIYSFFGHSKQSYHQYSQRLLQTAETEMDIVQRLISYRLRHPMMGLRKLHALISPTIGRDKFYTLARKHKLLACTPKNAQRTTYPVRFSQSQNLLIGKQFTALNHVWVTDITYFRVGNKFYYLSFIMDLYSRKIVASIAAPTLQASHSLEVLQQAISQRDIQTQNRLIHHSDKGTQYFCNAYIELLNQYNISRSTSNAVLENAHAERLNGIIKNEYLQHFSITSFETLQVALKKAVRLYNEERPHDSLGGLTPIQFEMSLPDIPIKDRYSLTVFTIKKEPINKMQIGLFQNDSLQNR